MQISVQVNQLAKKICMRKTRFFPKNYQSYRKTEFIKRLTAKGIIVNGKSYLQK